MKFLKKNNRSKIVEEGLVYRNPNHRNGIRQILIEEQKGFNKYELYQDRLRHICRIRAIKEMCDSSEEFVEILSSDKSYLSFITALEAELKIELFHLLN
ncbi:MAG: hypothetical protein K8S16_09395 [Bacteroidales bacterium]|nr:hypothetical protein [Bacteroidales bacterium]